MSKRQCPIPAIRDLTTAELAILDGATVTTAELNLLDGQTATAAEQNLSADVSSYLQEYTATAPAAIPATVRFIELNHASTAIEKTVADASVWAGQLVVIKNTSASGTAAHTVTLTAGTFDGSNNVATLNAPGECLMVVFDSGGNGIIVENVGSVGLS